jgi:hypothetical protein
MRIGHPGIIFPCKAGRTPGYFDFTKKLNNPTVADIDDAMAELRRWITVNSEDPEFTSIQINFMFAGHGYGVRWTPLVGQPIGLNKVVGLAARETLTGLARPLQRFNFPMC